MENKWEKERAARDGAASKMSATWTDIFPSRKHFIDMQRERMGFDRERVKEKLNIRREKIDLKTKRNMQNGSLNRRRHCKELFLQEIN